MIPDTRPVEILTDGDLLFNRDEYPLLQQMGFDSFDAFRSYDGGTLIKKIRERSVIRIPIPKKHGGGAYFLKRHRAEPYGHRKCYQGRIEFENILAFRRKEIATVLPAVMGERITGSIGNRRVESFIATRDYAPFTPLETLLEKTPEIFAEQKNKDSLMQAIAALAQKMHWAGFNHKDFNATHILLRYADIASEEPPALALYDLQRVDQKKIFRFRWIIKSLAEVGYTLPEPLFSAQDRNRLLCFYKGKESLSPWDRFQYRWIERKRERIARHTEKIRMRQKKEESISESCAELNP